MRNPEVRLTDRILQIPVSFDTEIYVYNIINISIQRKINKDKKFV